MSPAPATHPGLALEGCYADLKALLEADAHDEARRHTARTADFAVAGVTLLLVIPNPAKIWCAGLNYAEHVQKTGCQVSEQPVYFLRVADSQVGHGGAIPRPPESVKLDHEGEIAVIIGKSGRRIVDADAWNHVAGYACYNDAWVRDWQTHTQQWGPGKNFWRTRETPPRLQQARSLSCPDRDSSSVISGCSPMTSRSSRRSTRASSISP